VRYPAATIALAALFAACAPTRHEPAALQPSLSLPSPTAAAPASLPGLHNLVAYTPTLLVGSAPDDDRGFQSLKSLGVRTIISVDGARPDAAAARRAGLRYIHLPIGYNGMDRDRTLQIAAAIRDAQAENPGGPVYVHCHHGKHRAAGAAAAAAVTLGELTNDQATGKLRVSGTSPSYPGLFACVAAAAPAAAAQLDAIDTGAFPEVAPTTSLVQAMVLIDETLDRLTLIAAAGWSAPTDHPDLVPGAEASTLADLLRDLDHAPYLRSRPEGFREMMSAAAAEAKHLEADLMSAAPGSTLSERLGALSRSCTACHARYRD
jgi:protein tyrosine phosphatase (PTP) superfamily phosphohydrolase (DUF442 family)